MTLCPPFFSSVKLAQGYSQEVEMPTAIKKSIQEDIKRYQTAISKIEDKAQFPLPVNPGEGFPFSIWLITRY